MNGVPTKPVDVGFAGDGHRERCSRVHVGVVPGGPRERGYGDGSFARVRSPRGAYDGWRRRRHVVVHQW